MLIRKSIRFGSCPEKETEKKKEHAVPFELYPPGGQPEVGGEIESKMPDIPEKTKVSAGQLVSN